MYLRQFPSGMNLRGIPESAAICFKLHGGDCAPLPPFALEPSAGYGCCFRVLVITDQIRTAVYEGETVEHRYRPRPKIGLALGSSSARGWAHIGMLEALDEAGIWPDVVCGCSISALVGASYRARMSRFHSRRALCALAQ
jgi:hypothetical protein